MNAKADSQEKFVELNWYLNSGVALQHAVAGSNEGDRPVGAVASGSDSNKRGGDLSFAIPAFGGTATSILTYITGSSNRTSDS